MLMAAAKQIEEQALQLAPAKRVKLAEKLLESVDSFTSPVIAQAWDSEIKQRLEDIRSGRAAAVPAEQVVHEARQSVREARRLSLSRRKGTH